RAQASGELGKIVGRVQIDAGVLPVAAIDEIVPVGDLIVDRAAVVTIRDAAVHAARGLIARRLLRQRNHELAEMTNPIGGRPVAPVPPIDLEKAGDFAHPLLRRRRRRAAARRPRAPWGRRARGGIRTGATCGTWGG